MRRAVSSVYYAVFHEILRTAAKRFLGPDQEHAAAYGILYRSFDHRHMKVVCEALRVPTLKDKCKRPSRRTAVGQYMLDFVEIFPSRQDARHRADYDPSAKFLPSNVLVLINLGVSAIAAFDRATLDEQTDVLALMMVGVRD